MQSKPVYPKRGTKEERAAFVAEFRHLWQIHPDTDLQLRQRMKWALLHMPMRINGRKFQWQRGEGDFPWGLIHPYFTGWNPVMVQPSELRTWLSIPDNELKAVHRANLEAAKLAAAERPRPPFSWSFGKTAAVVAVVFLVAALFIDFLPDVIAVALFLGILMGAVRWATISVALRFRRDSPFSLYRERQPAHARDSGARLR